jgi:hypothetical protein
MNSTLEFSVSSRGWPEQEGNEEFEADSDADQEFQAVVQSFDAVVDKAAELAPALALITPVAKEFLHGMNEMRASVHQAADRLAQYNAA